MKILQINSSVRGADSESTRVASRIVARLTAANPAAQLTAAPIRIRRWTVPPWAPCSPRPRAAAPSSRPAWRWTTR
jgi:hypothetical protein